MARYDDLLALVPGVTDTVRGGFYRPKGRVLPYRSGPYELLFQRLPASTEFIVTVRGELYPRVTSNADGEAVVVARLGRGTSTIELTSTADGRKFPSTVVVRRSATVLAAQAAVIATIDDALDDMQSSLGLSRVPSAYAESVYGRHVLQPNRGWEHEAYRAVLRQLWQAYRVYGSKPRGLRSLGVLLGASPLRIPREWRAEWRVGHSLATMAPYERLAAAGPLSLPNQNERSYAFVHANYAHDLGASFPGPFRSPGVYGGANAGTVTLGQPSGAGQSLYCSEAAFDESYVGSLVTVRGAAFSGNNGAFIVSSVIDDRNLVLVNPLGQWESSGAGFEVVVAAAASALVVRFAVGWDGGAVTVVGVDPEGNAVTETFTPLGAMPLAAAEDVVGAVAFCEVTSAAKASVGAGTVYASIGVDFRFVDGDLLVFGSGNNLGASALAFTAGPPETLTWAGGEPVNLTRSGVYTLRGADYVARFFTKTGTGPFAFGTNNRLRLSADGLPAVNIALGASPRSRADVAADINTTLEREQSYGAVPAVGTVTCPQGSDITAAGSPVRITFNDGINAALDLEFVLATPATAGRVAVVYTDLDTPEIVAANLAGALYSGSRNGNGAVMSPSVCGALALVGGSDGTDTVQLVHTYGGAVGNQTITLNAAAIAAGFTKTDMAGGVDGGYGSFATPVTVGAFDALQLQPPTSSGDASRIRVEASPADAADVVLGLPEALGATSGATAAQAASLTLAASPGPFPTVDEALVLHAAVLDTTASVSSAFSDPRRPTTLDLMFDAAWHGGGMAVTGVVSDGTTVREEVAYPEADGAHASGLRLCSFDGLTLVVGGRGDSIGGVAPSMTLTDAAGDFDASWVGGSVTLRSATTAANNGTFVITAVGGGGTTLSYTNAGGVAEAFTGVWSVDRGESFESALGADAARGMFVRRADGTGAFIDTVTGPRSITLATAMAGAPFGPVEWTVRKAVTASTAGCFASVSQLDALDVASSGTAGRMTLTVADAHLRSYAVRIGRGERASGSFAAELLTAVDDGLKTATLTLPFALEPDDGWILISGATSASGCANGLHEVIVPAPGSAEFNAGQVTLRHERAMHEGRFISQPVPGTVSYTVYSRGELVRVASYDTAAPTAMGILPPGPLHAWGSGSRVELADELPFEVRGPLGGEVEVTVNRRVRPLGNESDTLTLVGSNTPDGWRAQNCTSSRTHYPTLEGGAPNGMGVASYYLASGVDTAGIGTTDAVVFGRLSDARGRVQGVELARLRGRQVRIAFSIQQHVAAASENFRAEVNFASVASWTAGSTVAVDGVIDGALGVTEVAVEAEVPYDAEVLDVRLRFLGAAAAELFSVHEVRAWMLQGGSGLFLGPDGGSVVYGAHESQFGELVYTWTAGDVSGDALTGDEDADVERHVQRMTNAHGVWRRIDQGLAASAGGTAALVGAYTDTQWTTAAGTVVTTLEGMELVPATPARFSGVRPSEATLVRDFPLGFTAPSNADVLDTGIPSAHEGGGGWPEAPFDDEELWEGGEADDNAAVRVPNDARTSGGSLPWRWVSATQIQVASLAAGDSAASAIYDSSASYALTYRRLQRATVVMDLGADYAACTWLVDAVMWRRVEPTATTVARSDVGLAFDTSRRAKLRVASDQVMATSALVGDTGIRSFTVPPSAWRYTAADEVEVNGAYLDPNAVYTLSYVAREALYPTVPAVVIEMRSGVSAIAAAAADWREVAVDEVAPRLRYHEMRVTVSGVLDPEKDFVLYGLGLRGVRLALDGSTPDAPGIIP